VSFGGDNSLNQVKLFLGKKGPFFTIKILGKNYYLLETKNMNRSYSKIRHIQESNQRLEKRLLKEDESQMIGMVNNELSSVGEEPVSPEDVEFALNDCPLETPPNIDEKQQTVLQQVKGEINKLTSIGDVKNLIKKIKSIFKRKTQSEQAEIITIGSMAVPIVFIQVLAGIIIIMLVIKLIKLIGGDTRTSPECRRASRRMRRYGATG